MPNFKSSIDFQLFRQLKVYLRLKMGATRGWVPPAPESGGGSNGEAQRVHRQLAAKNKQISKRDREIKQLRARLEGEGEAAPLTQGSGEVSPPVFFVVGRGKSGTSWLMRTFNAHPEILCRGEGRFFGKDWKRDDLKDEPVNVPPRSLYGAIHESEYLRHWVERSVWSRDADADEHLAAITRAATEYFLKKRLSEAGKSIVGDKTPFLGTDFIREISEVYPEAKVIHIIRDGRDVTVSAVHHQWNKSKDQGGILTITPDSASRREAYRKDPQSTSMFTESHLRGRAQAWSREVRRAVEDGPALLGDNYVEVRYEDLLQRPEQEIGHLLEFLGAWADERTVSKCVKAASFEKMSKGRKPGEEDSTSFFRKGVAGDWKNVFTERDRKVFDEEAGDLLVMLGYEKAR